METKYQIAFERKYKIVPSDLIEKIATKHFGKIKYIGLNTLISEEVEKDGIEANEEFYKMLIEALAEGGVKLPENQKLQEVNVAFEIPNKEVSIPKSKGDLQDFKDIVSTDDLRPAMMGVYVSKDGYLVGTDAHKLVKFKSNLFNKEEEQDKIIDLKKYIGTNGKSIDFIDQKYPNYDAIIPRNNEHKRTSLNTYAFYNFCKSAIYLKKYQTSDIFHLTLLIEGKEYKFNPILFAELLEFALRKGFENFDVEVSESQTRAMLLTFVGGSEGLIMPIYSDLNVPRTIPYEIDEVERLFRGGKTAKKSASPSPKKPKATESPKKDEYKKFEGDIQDTTYVSRREIRSISLENGETLSKNDVVDGFYRLKKKYEVGGIVERYDNPLFNQGMQGELSGFGTSSPMSVFANGGTTDPQKFNQDNLMSEGGKMSVIEQILKKYNVSKEDETSEWLKKEWEGKNVDDYVMYSDKYGRGGKLSPAQERAFFGKSKTKFTQLDAESLVGKFIEIYGQGQVDPIAFSKIAKATIDPNYSQKTLVIYTETGTQERIPEDKIDAFFNGVTIVLSIPSKGSYYGLKLIKESNEYAKGGEINSINFDFSFDTDGDYEDRNIEEEKIKYLRTKIDFDEVRGDIDYRREENNTFLRFFKNGELVMRIKGNGHINGVDAEISAFGLIGYLNYHPQDGFGGLNMHQFKREINRVFEDFSEENKQYSKGGEISNKRYRVYVTTTERTAYQGKYFVEASSRERAEQIAIDNYKKEYGTKRGVQIYVSSIDEVPMQDGKERTRKYFVKLRNAKGSERDAFIIDAYNSSTAVDRAFKQFRSKYGRPINAYNDNQEEFLSVVDDVYPIAEIKTNGETTYKRTFAKGGEIGFIPIEIERKIALLSHWGGTNERGVIGLLNAMVDSGITDEDLKYTLTQKETRLRRERAIETKVDEIWNKIQPKYNQELKGNMYYSTLNELITRNGYYKNLLKDFKPFRKYQKFAKGGEVEITNSTIDRGGLGSVQDSILAKGGLLKKAQSIGKRALKKAKPVAKKIVRKSKKYGAVALKKAKIGFDALAKKVAESYEGKKVKPKYQSEYGKTYSKAEAKEVGEKVSAKVYRQQLGKKKITRKLQTKTK